MKECIIDKLNDIAGLIEFGNIPKQDIILKLDALKEDIQEHLIEDNR